MHFFFISSLEKRVHEFSFGKYKVKWITETHWYIHKLSYLNYKILGFFKWFLSLPSSHCSYCKYLVNITCQSRDPWIKLFADMHIKDRQCGHSTNCMFKEKRSWIQFFSPPLLLISTPVSELSCWMAIRQSAWDLVHQLEPYVKTQIQLQESAIRLALAVAVSSKVKDSLQHSWAGWQEEKTFVR